MGFWSVVGTWTIWFQGGGMGRRPGTDDLFHPLLRGGHRRHGRLGLLHEPVHSPGVGSSLDLTDGVGIGLGQGAPVLAGIIALSIAPESGVQISQIGLLELADGGAPHGVQGNGAVCLGGQALYLGLVAVAHRSGRRGRPEGVCHQVHRLTVDGALGLDLTLSPIGVQLNGVMIGAPLGVKGDPVPVGFLAGQIAH